MRGKAKDFDAESMGTMDAFYAFLDANALVLHREHALIDVLVKFRNKELDVAEKQRMQWEVEAFLFAISRDGLFSFSTSTGLAANEISEFPVLDDFQAGGFDYLKERAASAKNPLLLARYNHLLWTSNVCAVI